MKHVQLSDTLLEVVPENDEDRAAIKAHWPGTGFEHRRAVQFTVKAVTRSSRPLPLWLQAFNWKDL